jgi:hypothetical protein
VHTILSVPLPWIRKPQFQFSLTRAAATTNFVLLQRHDPFKPCHSCPARIARVLWKRDSPSLTFGVCFLLTPPVAKGERCARRARRGVVFPFDPISKEERDQNNAFTMKRGNHKSSDLHPSAFNQLITTEVRRGFQLPPPLDAWRHLPNDMVAPAGMNTQGSIYEFGQLIFKDRATFDQSCPGPTGEPVHKRVETLSRTPCKFGFCIKRIINYIVFLRHCYPSNRILVGKFDWKTAYRRGHLSG